MLKINYIITLLGGIGIFNSCTGNFINPQTYTPQISMQKQETAYGNYLAGRVAHMRQDYENASLYYVKSIDKGLTDSDLIGKTYIILASQGKIEKAVKYANIARQQGDTNNFIDVINAVNSFKHSNYKFARANINKIEEKTYKKLISPLFNAWAYAGESDFQNAIKELKPLAESDELKTVYYLHSGLISEYFKRNKDAEKYYKLIIEDTSNDMSCRALQIISNFLVRNNKKAEAEKIIAKYYGSSNLKEMLKGLSDKIKISKPSDSPIVKTANDGAGEVFLEIGLLFKSVPVGQDYAQMYMAISEYFNPNNDITKIAIADIYEERNQHKDANKYYDSIYKNSEMYYPAQMRKASNLIDDKKYKDAAMVLKKLLKNNPNNYQVLFNLGDALRISNNQEDAIKYYKKAIDSIFYESEKYWPIYYAIAVSYDKNNQWIEAEKNLKKALKLSNRHPQVLNYLGYSWLKYGINTDAAAAMILEAYEKEPNDSIILDSLGWVYFKTGDYKNAINYLEKASELDPQNAVITDHLGDAYWQGGRKNEAIFQWKRAIKQKDIEEELNIKNVKNKIKNGPKGFDIITLKDEQTNNMLKQLENITN